MEQTIWSDVLIAFIAAVLTWFFNRLTIVAEIKKAKKDKINENRIAHYTECYEILERNIVNNNLVFQREYIDSLIKIKPKMKLMASNNVLQAFKAYYKWVVDTYKSYLDFCAKNDPTNNVHIETAPDGTEFEVPDFNEHDLKYYEFQQKEYIADRGIKLTTVKSKTQDILNAMRSDLGNDVFIDNFLS